MILAFALYDIATGEIVGNFTGLAEQVPYQLLEGQSFVKGKSDDLIHYIVDGVITDKPSMDLTLDKSAIIANGVDEAVIGNVPIGAVCQGVEIDDGELIFTTDKVAEHVLKFELFPYLDGEVTIHGTT